MSSPTRRHPTIILYDLAGPALIIPWPSGVIYQNQVGGHYVMQYTQEGVFVPLPDDLGSLSSALESHFLGPKYRGWGGHGIDEETAQFIDELFQRNPRLSMIFVDRHRFQDSVEAWIWVTVAEETFPMPFLDGLTPCTGILTWSNSD